MRETSFSNQIYPLFSYFSSIFDDVDLLAFDDLITQIQTNITTCAPGQTAPEGKACRVDLEPIRKLCDQNATYGYADGSPCVFLQLNYHLLTNYTPVVYEADDLVENNDLPDDLRTAKNLNGPWVECHGNTVVDQESVGSIKVAPSNVIPLNFFPYDGVNEDYMSPVIAIKFEKPATGINIGLTCRFWAKNIGTRTVFDKVTNTTLTENVDDSLPLAVLPVNLYIE